MVDTKRVLALAAVPLTVVALLVVLLGVATVPAGHTGVEKGYAGDTTGAQLGPGTHVINPLHSVQTVECRPRTYTMADTVGEGDRAQQRDAVVVDSVNGTTHRVDVTIRYQVDCSQAVEFVERWKTEDQMEQRLIRPDVRSDLRDRGASIRALQMFKTAGREQLASTAAATLRENFQDEPVELLAVKIREVTIPGNLSTELERKVQAKVRIETKENEIRVERKEAERKRIEAQADARVIEIRGEALRNNPIVLRQRYIEALKNGSAVYVVPSGGAGNATGGSAATGAGGTPIILDPQEDAGGERLSPPGRAGRAGAGG